MSILNSPISTISKNILNKNISPVELINEQLEAIDRLNPSLNAYITVFHDEARRAARAAEKEILAGNYIGPMHGIPIAHKDIILTKGLRTTGNSILLKDWIPDQNATVAQKLEDSGAILLGKLNLHEFAMQRPGADVAFPPARNPWDVNRSPGGSSSGSGTAVSARLAFGVTGTDTGGSIRHPASASGIVGIKPTHGRVSLHGVIPLASSLDHVGPMTRTVRDNAIMLQFMAGYDSCDPWSVKQDVPDFSKHIGRSINGYVAGIPWKQIESAPHDDQILQAFNDSCKALASLGVKFKEIVIDKFDSSYFTSLIGAEAWLYHCQKINDCPSGYSAGIRERFELIKNEVNINLLAEAEQYRRRITIQITNILRSDVDFIITPGRAMPADILDESVPLSTPPGAAYFLYNMAGVPSIVVPSGYTKEGLPIGLQIAANYWQEDFLYQIGAAFEDQTEYWKRIPKSIEAIFNRIG